MPTRKSDGLAGPLPAGRKLHRGTPAFASSSPGWGGGTGNCSADLPPATRKGAKSPGGRCFRRSPGVTLDVRRLIISSRLLAGEKQREEMKMPVLAIHPGEHWGEELKELNMSAAALARRRLYAATARRGVNRK